MELKRAKEVLESFVTIETGLLRVGSLTQESVVRAYYGKSYLNGRFTADQLIAIATWMRDPEGVVGA